MDRWLDNYFEIPRIIPDIPINMAGSLVRQVVTESLPPSNCSDRQTFSEIGVSREITNCFRGGFLMEGKLGNV